MADDKTQTTTSAGKNDRKRTVRMTYAPDFAGQPVYADGVHGVMLRGGVAHIDLYQTITPGNEKQSQPEQRVVSHRLVLPLPALGELGRIIGSLRQAMEKGAQRLQAETGK
ncbi:MAG: hypothetical protein KF834_02110 [Burkholderiales bacterium]|nr:hypothetical protein [Burkholderiales bacterium]